MFKFFRKKQPAPAPAPAEPKPAAPQVPDAGGWGRHVEPAPPAPPGGELPPGHAARLPAGAVVPGAPATPGTPTATPDALGEASTPVAPAAPVRAAPAPVMPEPAVSPVPPAAPIPATPAAAPQAPVDVRALVGEPSGAPLIPEPPATEPASPERPLLIPEPVGAAGTDTVAAPVVAVAVTPPPPTPPRPASTVAAEPAAGAPAASNAPVSVAPGVVRVADPVEPATTPAPGTVPAEPSAAADVSPPVAPPATAAPIKPTKPEPLVGGKPAQRPGAAPRRAAYVAPTPAAALAPEAAKSSWLSRLRSGLSRTGQSFTNLFVDVKVDEDLFEELETALIMSDAGVEATENLLDALRARVRKERIEDGNRVKEILRELITEHLAPLERPFDLARAKPLVVMIAGVNGAGKTTSIGKLARHFQHQGSSVLLAAGDTFRAAAREQLVQWGERNNVAVIAQGDGSDPAAVAFDAVQAGRARDMQVVMVDTAGRLPTQLHLMAELKKIRRVIAKADAEAPHEVLLVVDGNTGQNALAQIKAFDEALGLTGLVVTKLDGTAKGGILAAVAAGSQGVRPVPVYWIGVGEDIEDLQPFVASEFAGAMLGG